MRRTETFSSVKSYGVGQTLGIRCWEDDRVNSDLLNEGFLKKEN